MVELILAGLAPILLAFGLYALWEAVESLMALRRLSRPTPARTESDDAIGRVAVTAGVAGLWYSAGEVGAGHACDHYGAGGYGGDVGCGSF